MTIWLDNHLSPTLAAWLEQYIGEPCVQVRDLGLARAADVDMFRRARAEARIFVTKDRDFADLVSRLGPPPAIVLLAIGNTSTTEIKSRYADPLAKAISIVGAGEPLVEIGAA